MAEIKTQIPPTPEREEDFDVAWAEAVTTDFIKERVKEDEDLDEVSEAIEIKRVTAKKNEVQGILSTTYIVSIHFTLSGEDQEREASVFVKVPLKDEPMYESVNVRELVMFRDVLPKLQAFLDEKCEGFFRLPMPRYTIL